MAPKREREEDCEPVFERRGPVVIEAGAGYVCTIEDLSKLLNEQKDKNEAYAKEIAEKNQELELKNREMAMAAGLRDQERLEEQKKLKEQADLLAAETSKTDKLNYVLNSLFVANKKNIDELKELKKGNPTTGHTNAELNELRNQLSVANRRIENLQKKVNAAENTTPAPTPIPAPIPAQIPYHQTKEYQTLENQLKRSRELATQKIKASTDKIQKLEAENKKLELEIDTVLNKSIEDKEVIKELEQNRDSWEECAEERRRKIEELEGQAAGEAYQQLLAESCRRQKEDEDEKNHLRAQLAAVQAEARAQIAALRARTEYEKTASLEAAVADYKHELAQAKNQRAEASTQAAALQAQLERKKEETDQLRAKAAEAEAKTEDVYRQAVEYIAGREAIINDYEEQARAHVCAAATSAPPPRVALTFSGTISVTTAPEAAQEAESDPLVDELCGIVHNCHLNLAAEKEEPKPALSPRTPSPTPSSTPSFASSPSLADLYLSLPPTPPSSPPSATASVARPFPYPTEDDDDPFNVGFEPRPYIHRRTAPFCGTCRTRKSLRLVDGEWKKPAGLYGGTPCARHNQYWWPRQENEYRVPTWVGHCADCIQSDLDDISSGQEDQLPAEIREEYRCRGPNCDFADAHNRVREYALYVNEERKRLVLHKQQAQEARWEQEAVEHEQWMKEHLAHLAELQKL